MPASENETDNRHIYSDTLVSLSHDDHAMEQKLGGKCRESLSTRNLP